MRPTRIFLLSVLLLVLSASVTTEWVVASSFRAAEHSVCRLVGEHYFRNQEPRVKDWVSRCQLSADHENFAWQTDEEVARINRRLRLLEISHLTLYSPPENRQIWENESLETGIRSRMIDGALVIYAIVPGSAAEGVGLKPGDVLLKADGKSLNSSYDAQSVHGQLLISRLGKLKKFNITPNDLTENLSPVLQPLANHQGRVGLLRIQSFLGQYFDQEAWRNVTDHLRDYQSIVIDLRGNAGGSFPAMLRAVSPFRCEEPQIGQLFHESGRHAESSLPDDLDASIQLQELKNSDRVQLRAFKAYGCFPGPVTVLIDGDTSSVAEIFAHAFFLRRKSHVWGQPSAGQVVMAQWFPIYALGGDDFSLSIPIAGYRSVDGVELENQGLEPERVLHYNLNLAETGRDSWVEDAARAFFIR